MFKIGDKVRVVNDRVSYANYKRFYEAHSIMNLYGLTNRKYLENDIVGTVEFIGADPSPKYTVLVVVSVNGTMYLIEYDGLELVEEVNESKYNLKKETMAQKVVTDKFEVELWETDDSYTLYFDKYLMVEMLNSEELDELIYILQETKKLKQ